MADIEKQEQQSLLSDDTKKNDSESELDFRFAHYFKNESEPFAEHCGQCIGETFLPCVPGCNCQTKLCLNCCEKWRAPPIFWTFNYLALIGHLINTILTVVYSFINEDVVFNLNEISESWVDETGTTMCTANMPPNSFDARVIQANNRTMCVSYSSESTATISLFSLIIWFHLLSFIFQTLAMCDWNFPLFLCCSTNKSDSKGTGFCGCLASLRAFRCNRQRYVDEVIIDGTNMLRMIEYSLSATLMQVAIALVLGIDSRLVIVSIASLTAIVMLLGLIAEQLKGTMLKSAWISHLLGWLAMFTVWYLIFAKFNHSVKTSEADGGDGPPDFVFTLIVSIALFFMGFGFLQFAQLCWITVYGKTSGLFNKNIETGYNFMSLTSKTFLGAFLLSNVLFAPRVVDVDQCVAYSRPEWEDLGCNVTNINATNVTDLGEISPAAGFKLCIVKCEATGTNFTIDSKENKCQVNQTLWAEKGCAFNNVQATTVSELNATAADGFGSCDVTCPVDGQPFEVAYVEAAPAPGASAPAPAASAPASTPAASAPASTPASAPAPASASTPASAPAPASASTPASAPAPASASTPASAPASAPAPAPAAVVVYEVDSATGATGATGAGTGTAEGYSATGATGIGATGILGDLATGATGIGATGILGDLATGATGIGATGITESTGSTGSTGST
jgi:hypothetical protein